MLAFSAITVTQSASSNKCAGLRHRSKQLWIRAITFTFELILLRKAGTRSSPWYRLNSATSVFLQGCFLALNNPRRLICYLNKWRCPWYNGYRRRKWTWWHEFKSWTRLIAFHIALTLLGMVWIQLFSLQLWVSSRADWVPQSWWGN